MITQKFTGWTGTNSKTATTSGASWTITFTNTVTFASADAARYFFNAGGRIKIDVSKTSTGNTGDPEWNDLANTLCGDIFITGGTATQTIAGSSYTGTTKVGGTGTPMVQVIPCKRESWKANYSSLKEGEYKLMEEAGFNAHIRNHYKRFVWTKKDFK